MILYTCTIKWHSIQVIKFQDLHYRSYFKSCLKILKSKKRQWTGNNGQRGAEAKMQPLVVQILCKCSLLVQKFGANVLHDASLERKQRIALLTRKLLSGNTTTKKLSKQACKMYMPVNAWDLSAWECLTRNSYYWSHTSFHHQVQFLV